MRLVLGFLLNMELLIVFERFGGSSERPINLTTVVLKRTGRQMQQVYYCCCLDCLDGCSGGWGWAGCCGCSCSVVVVGGEGIY